MGKLILQAHWFEMDRFWVEAAKVVKPGGTVALWTLCEFLGITATIFLLTTLQHLLSVVSSRPSKVLDQCTDNAHRSQYTKYRKGHGDPSSPRKGDSSTLHNPRKYTLNEYVRRSPTPLEYSSPRHRIPPIILREA